MAVSSSKQAKQRYYVIISIYCYIMTSDNCSVSASFRHTALLDSNKNLLPVETFWHVFIYKQQYPQSDAGVTLMCTSVLYKLDHIKINVVGLGMETFTFGAECSHDISHCWCKNAHRFSRKVPVQFLHMDRHGNHNKHIFGTFTKFSRQCICNNGLNNLKLK